MVDVVTDIYIDRPVDVVAAYAEDPNAVPRWYQNIESASWHTDPPIHVGSEFAFVAKFMGRRLEYRYEVVEYEPKRRLVMRVSDGPFPMETTYEWMPEGNGTRMTLRNRGEPAGWSKLIGLFMPMAMRRANRKDLAQIKAQLEAA